MVIKLTVPYSGDVSSNRYMRNTPKGGRYVIESARLWSLFVKSGLNSRLPQDYSPEQLDPAHPFDLDVYVAFPRQFSKRSGDASNFDKWPRDIVTSVLQTPNEDAGTSGTPTATYGHKDEAFILLTIKLHFQNGLHDNDENAEYNWDYKTP